MLHSPIITPYNLLENAKLDNYSYVNYYKRKSGLVAEIKCLMDHDQEVVFYYYFNYDDKLEKVYEERDGLKSIVFDREKELDSIKKSYFAKSKDLIKTEAI